MASFPLGCQTITFGDSQSANFDEVFAAVAAAGFTGVEIGYRHIRKQQPKALVEQLRRHGLTLLASHVGGSLYDTDSANRERSLIESVIHFLHEAAVPQLMYSGLRYDNDAQLGRDLDALSRAADLCARHGIHLLYHNHDWEFEHGGRVIDAVLTRTHKSLGLCPDLGWIMKGGADPIAFLERAKTRLGAVHFKDFASQTKIAGKIDTTLLGQGAAPLREAAEWLKRNVAPMWVIAEQDQSDAPPAEAVRANGEFLKGLFH